MTSFDTYGETVAMIAEGQRVLGIALVHAVARAFRRLADFLDAPASRQPQG